MGRISKRKAAGSQTEAKHNLLRFKAGIYARLSSEQDTKKNESVEVQVEIAKKFVEQFNEQKTGKELMLWNATLTWVKQGAILKETAFCACCRTSGWGRLTVSS